MVGSLPFSQNITVLSYKNIFSKSDSKSWLKEIFMINYVFRAKSWAYKIKDLNVKTIMEAFVKNRGCRVS